MFFQVAEAPHSCSGQDTWNGCRKIYKVQDFDTKLSRRTMIEWFVLRKKKTVKNSLAKFVVVSMAVSFVLLFPNYVHWKHFHSITFLCVHYVNAKVKCVSATGMVASFSKNPYTHSTYSNWLGMSTIKAEFDFGTRQALCLFDVHWHMSCAITWWWSVLTQGTHSEGRAIFAV